jgi:hypothetical protein
VKLGREAKQLVRTIMGVGYKLQALEPLSWDRTVLADGSRLSVP